MGARTADSMPHASPSLRRAMTGAGMTKAITSVGYAVALMRDPTSPAVGTSPPARLSPAATPAAGPAGRVWLGAPSGTWRYVVLRRLLACADLGAALLATVAVALVTTADSSDVAWSLAFLPLWIVAAKLLGLYDRDEAVLRHSTVDEVPHLIVWSLVGTLSLSLLLQATPANPLPASAMIVAIVVAAGGVVVLRALARWLWRVVTPAERIALVGSPANVELFRRKLDLFPDLHMTVVVGERLTLLETTDADEWLDMVDRVVLAPNSVEEPGVAEILQLCRARGVPLTVVPPREVVFSNSVRMTRIAELPILDYSKVDLPRSTLLLKRILDVSVAAIALVVLALPLVVIGLAVKLDSRGSVLFRQLRAGQDGRAFRMLKFRTMVEDAEAMLPRLVRIDDLPEPVFKLENDPRVTRVGRILRRWSLDELPQLWNILRGDMSLVGPRPEELALVERYSPEQRNRLAINPGLTGPMQVYGRGALTLEERLAVECDYIENLSIGRDLRILGMTLGVVLGRRGAF